MQLIHIQHDTSNCQVSLSGIINAGTGVQLVYGKKVDVLLLVSIDDVLQIQLHENQKITLYRHTVSRQGATPAKSHGCPFLQYPLNWQK